MSEPKTVHDDNPPRMDEDLRFLRNLNDGSADHAAARKKEREASYAARDQKRAENKAKRERSRRIFWWLSLIHWIIHYIGCSCAIFMALLFGLPDNLAVIATVLVLAEFCCATRWIIRSRPRKESRNG